MDDYEKDKNELIKIVDDFGDYLTNEKKLSEKTVNKHVNNIYWFGLNYLIEYDRGSILDSDSTDILDYVGNFYIRKSLFCTKKDIDSLLTSFKKFFKYLKIKHLVDEYDWKEILTVCSDKLHFHDRFDQYFKLPNSSDKKFEEAWEDWFLSY